MGWYDQLHRGASGGTTAPDGWELFTGASQPTWRQLMKPYEIDGAAITSARGTYKLGPGAGRGELRLRERQHAPGGEAHQGLRVISIMTYDDYYYYCYSNRCLY